MLNHLADISIRSLAMPFIAVIVIRVLRHSGTAALRHAIWTAVVCGMLALFVFGSYLPRLPLRLPASSTSLPATSVVASYDLPLPQEEVAGGPNHVTAPAPHTVNWNQVALAAYGVIALIFLIRFLIGIFLARKLVVRSNRNGSYYESELISVPVTVGCFQPRIILPLECRAWENDKLHAVLTHERTHVRRRDGLVSALAHVNRCIFWFHPLAWIVERKLSLLAEQACDESCVAALGDRDRYAQLLLEMANVMDISQRRLRYHALTMAASSHIGQRIEALLEEGRTFSRGLTWAGWTTVIGLSIPIVLAAGVVEAERQLPPLHVVIPTLQPPPILLAQASPTLPASPPSIVRTPRAAFEAASIRPAAMPTPGGDGNGRGGGPGGGGPNCGPQRVTMDESLVHYRCVPVKGLIEFAYGIPQRPGLITGPDWMMDTSPGQRFDIEAKLPQGASKAQVPNMFQSLLQDRFKLVMHRGTSEQTINAIVVDKSGLKLKDGLANAPEPTPAPGAAPCLPEGSCAASIRNSHGEEVVSSRVARGADKYNSPSIGHALVTNSPQGTRIEAPNSTLAGLAILLQGRTPLDVIDMTGLTGRFQINVETSLDRNALMAPLLAASNAAAAGGPDSAAANAEFAAANQKTQEDMAVAEIKAWQVALLKVGLRLEQRKAAAETYVVDHVERMPTEN